MGRQRQLLGVKWQDHVKNTDIADMTGLLNIGDIITKRRHTLFGHVVRLEATTPAHKHWNKSLQRRLVVIRVLTGEDLRGVPGGHGYSRSAREPQPVGDRCGRTRRNVDIVESRRNGPQLSVRVMMMMMFIYRPGISPSVENCPCLAKKQLSAEA